MPIKNVQGLDGNLLCIKKAFKTCTFKNNVQHMWKNVQSVSEKCLTSALKMYTPRKIRHGLEKTRSKPQEKERGKAKDQRKQRKKNIMKKENLEKPMRKQKNKGK